MTFLGLERPVEWGRQQIFDPATASMVLNAQKDYANAVYNAYQDAKQDFKDFTKEYGDFMSPIQKDMEWYDREVTGKVRNTINNLYAQGIDPLRSAEGRAAVAQLIYSMPTGDIAKVRQSAETAKKYLDSFDEFTNPELEKMLGRDLSQWSTIDNGLWSTKERTKFQDLNQWTHHLFDDMELSFDPEESKKYPGYKAYTKSRDTMDTIVDTHIAQLLNSDLGKFYLGEVLKSIPEGTEDRVGVAINELKRRIVNANWEQNRVKLEADPYALARYQNSLRGSGGGGYRQPQQKLSFNYMNGIFQRGLTNAFGYDANTQEETALNNIMSDQIGFGQSMRKGSFSGPWAAYKANTNDYVNKFTIYENPMMFAGVIGRKMDNEGSVPLTRADLQNLRSQADVVTSTYGYPYSHIPTNSDKIRTMFDSAPVQKVNTTDGEGKETVEYEGIRMVPYQDVYTSYQRFGQNGAMDQQWKVAIINTHTGKHMGDFWYTIPNTREYNINIPSIKEWKKDKDGRYVMQDDELRGRAKAGINSRVRGANERASWGTTGMYGVTTHPFNRDVTYNQEGVSLSPYR